MSLAVYTARVSSRDPDRLDVTRRSAGPEGIVFAPSAKLLASGQSGRVSSASYAKLYTAEMRASYAAHRGTWDTLLARPRVVLCCYCTNPATCHRAVLAGILGKLGAEVRGEVGLRDAIDRVVAVAKAGKLTPLDLVRCADAAGAELCVVVATAEHLGIVAEGTYDRLQSHGLAKLAKQARAAMEKAS